MAVNCLVFRIVPARSSVKLLEEEEAALVDENTAAIPAKRGIDVSRDARRVNVADCRFCVKRRAPYSNSSLSITNYGPKWSKKG